MKTNLKAINKAMLTSSVGLPMMFPLFRFLLPVPCILVISFPKIFCGYSYVLSHCMAENIRRMSGLEILTNKIA